MKYGNNIRTRVFFVILDKYPRLAFEFVEHDDKTNQSSPVDFEFSDIYTTSVLYSLTISRIFEAIRYWGNQIQL